MAESEDVSGQMAVIDTELQRKREADIREHYNTKAREFADKLLPKLESQIKVRRPPCMRATSVPCTCWRAKAGEEVHP